MWFFERLGVVYTGITLLIFVFCVHDKKRPGLRFAEITNSWYAPIAKILLAITAFFRFVKRKTPPIPEPHAAGLEY